MRTGKDTEPARAWQMRITAQKPAGKTFPAGNAGKKVRQTGLPRAPFCENAEGSNVIRPGHHDAGIRAVTIHIGTQAGIKDHRPGVFRGVQEAQNAPGIATRKSDMRSVPVRPGGDDGDDDDDEPSDPLGRSRRGRPKRIKDDDESSEGGNPFRRP